MLKNNKETNMYWEIDKSMREFASRQLSEDWLNYDEYEHLIVFLKNLGKNETIEHVNQMYPDHKFRWDYMT